jgi:hypothetical protein
MNDLLSIIYRPRFEFNAVKDDKVNYVIILVILVLLTIIQGVISIPVQVQLLAHNDIFNHMPPEQAEKARSMAQTMKYFGIIIAAVVYLIKILIQALMVWGGVALFRGKINFKQSILIVSLVSFITILGDIANAGLIFATGIEKVTSVTDMYKSGLNVFFRADDLGTAMYTFLAYINPFQVWGIIIMIFGMMVVSEMELSNAAILSLILWLIWVAFPVVSVVMSEAAQARAGL